jgi:hypothetical protein
VAAELESRWNAAIAQLAVAEDRLKAEQQTRLLPDEDQKRRLLSLGADLKALWNDLAAPAELKKRIIRTVINEIVVDVNHASGHIEMRVHWVGGLHTMLRLHKNKSGRNGSATGQDVVELVREMAMGWSDAYIAAMLNRLGYSTGPGNSWNETRVKNLRLYNKIPVFTKGVQRPWLTMEEAAEELSVGVAVIRTMIKWRILPARQVAKGAPWMIQREELQKDDVQKYARQARSGKPAPCGDNSQTLMPYI